MQIKDITIQDYFTREDTLEYDIFINCMTPVNLFAGKQCQVSKLTFDEVEVIKSVFQNPTMEDIMELIILCYAMRGDMNQSAQEQYLKTSIFDLFRAKTFLQEFITKTIEKEVDWLSGKSDDKLLMINAEERLKPFSHILSKISLAEQFSTTVSEIGKWKYSTVFTILVANKVKADLITEYNEIK